MRIFKPQNVKKASANFVMNLLTVETPQLRKKSFWSSLCSLQLFTKHQKWWKVKYKPAHTNS